MFLSWGKQAWFELKYTPRHVFFVDWKETLDRCPGPFLLHMDITTFRRSFGFYLGKGERGENRVEGPNASKLGQPRLLLLVTKWNLRGYYVNAIWGQCIFMLSFHLEVLTFQILLSELLRITSPEHVSTSSALLSCYQDSVGSPLVLDGSLYLRESFHPAPTLCSTTWQGCQWGLEMGRGLGTDPRTLPSPAWCSPA